MNVQELRERQGWTLSQKIDHSMGVIDQFYNRLEGKCYVSFSGGKDSTIVMWLARKIFPNIKACFCNTGNEYPDIVRFVRGFDNVDWIKPKRKPHEVLAKYGFPLISKMTSVMMNNAKNRPNSPTGKFALESSFSSYYRIAKKYQFMWDKEYNLSARCCYFLKKAPFTTYGRETGLYPIIGTMASESHMRESIYLKNGTCNVFHEDKHRIMSLPLSIWTEEDVWKCIEKYKIPISDIYAKGAKRTGCMFCGYGCQFKEDTLLQLVYDLYPKWYDKFMGYTNNGVAYREALRDVLAVNGLYLPDEKPKELFDV